MKGDKYKKKIVFTKDYLEKHNKEEKIHLANIDIDSLSEFVVEEKEEGKIKIKKYGICKIQLYSNEGTIPHFHIENDDKTFLCCIRLDKPEYFNHGVKQNTLNKSQIKELIKILNNEVRETDLTIYQVMCIEWNSDLTNKIFIKKPFKMPNYLKLNEK